MNTERKTLILKTEGMSAYGLHTFDVHRKVSHFPTRSAILGMLGAAMGITRTEHEQLFELSQQLNIAVQVNCCGEKMVDYHTVQNFRSPHGKIQKGQTKPTYREYWSDAKHSFAVTASEDWADRLAEHLRAPTFTLFHGRKSCPLTRPLMERMVTEDNPVDALIKEDNSGHIYSDVTGQHQIAIMQVRDLTTKVPRKYAMRTVYVCSSPSGSKEEQTS